MLINAFSSKEPCTKRYGNEVHDEPGEKDTHVLADLVLGVKYDL